MEVTQYLAHIKDSSEEQTVLAHLVGTSGLAEKFADAFYAGEQGKLAGLFHDIGKYSDAFQRRLKGGSIVDHSTAGAFECYKGNQVFAALAISGHHGGIPDLGGRGDTEESNTFMGRMKKGVNGKLEPYDAFASDVSMPEAKLPPFVNSCPQSQAMFVRMLYSCLVDADFLDTEAFMSMPREHNYADMEELENRFLTYIAPFFPAQNELNSVRCALLNICSQIGAEAAPGLFTLTVPTGGGKTLSSLAFALRHAVAHQKKRIIFVVPFTSIIEQTSDVYRKIFGSENVLEHHSGVIYGLDGHMTQDDIRLAQATENWDMPIVVTTAVQFFESLYSNKPSKCRKLHNIADSIIIFDEAQMIPIPYLRPCVFAMAELARNYESSIVLCTATQPALDEMLIEFNPKAIIREICPQSIRENPIFRRTVIRIEGKLSNTELCERLSGIPQVLCIVNSRKAAEEIVHGLPSEGTFHLSTLMYPAHRRQVLEEIRARLNQGTPCRVVSTSLIEAGVDVDFPLVYRELAGLDSMLQAAGRCNREGKHSPENSVVTVFESENGTPPLFSAQVGAARNSLQIHSDAASSPAIHSYFTELMALAGVSGLDQKQILNLEQKSLPFSHVAELFKLIENDTRTIYIPEGDGAPLCEKLLAGTAQRADYRRLAQYAVSVYPLHFQSLEEAGAIQIIDEETAVLICPDLYSRITGLSSKADTGRALFI